jgi:hypothetical protein
MVDIYFRVQYKFRGYWLQIFTILLNLAPLCQSSGSERKRSSHLPPTLAKVILEGVWGLGGNLVVTGVITLNRTLPYIH